MHHKVYIVHGYSASPDSHWFPWLTDQLAALDIKTHVLPMPDSAHPDASTWIGYLSRHVATHDEHTYFIGHSLGCIALLRHFDSLAPGSRVGGLILVAGFANSLPEYPNLDHFTEPGFDTRKIISLTSNRAVIVSDNDPIVPPADTEALSRQIDAQLLHVEHGGHFMKDDGFTEFPLVFQLLQGMLKQNQ